VAGSNACLTKNKPAASYMLAAGSRNGLCALSYFRIMFLSRITATTSKVVPRQYQLR
jgi:hypothetical protein